jgi:hypothetical protein
VRLGVDSRRASVSARCNEVADKLWASSCHGEARISPLGTGVAMGWVATLDMVMPVLVATGAMLVPCDYVLGYSTRWHDI